MKLPNRKSRADPWTGRQLTVENETAVKLEQGLSKRWRTIAKKCFDAVFPCHRRSEQSLGVLHSNFKKMRDIGRQDFPLILVVVDNHQLMLILAARRGCFEHDRTLTFFGREAEEI